MSKITYKPFIIIPIILLVFSIGILVNNYYQTGEFFDRAVQLKGGTIIEVNTENQIDILELKDALSEFGDIQIKEWRSITGYGIQVITGFDTNTTLLLKEIEAQGIDVTEYSVESMGPALGEAFWIQTQMALIAAFILMAIIVFLIFRKSVPSMAVIISAVSDILITLAFMQIFDINISLAGLAALLMLIGYSVDTDIMLTSRLLKRHGEGSLSEGVRGALKTGLTMTITTIGALSVIVITNVTPVLTEIAGILLIGLSIDIVNTWLMNSVLLRWYLERKGG